MTAAAAAVGDQDPRVGNARVFDEIAEAYDATGVSFFGPIAAGLVDALAPTAGERVADLGCGKGAFLLRAARQITGTGMALGVDISPAMVALARSALAAEGLSHAQALVGDAQAPALEAGAFDALGSSAVLFFLPDPPAALTSWRAALRPGGRIGVSTFGPQDEAWRSVDDVFTPYLPTELLDARTSGARGPFSSDSGMEGLLLDAGFDEVATITVDLSVHFADADRWYAFSMSTGQRAMWAHVPADSRAKVRAEAERRLAAAADPGGGYLVHQQVRYTLGVRPS